MNGKVAARKKKTKKKTINSLTAYYTEHKHPLCHSITVNTEDIKKVCCIKTQSIKQFNLQLTRLLVRNRTPVLSLKVPSQQAAQDTVTWEKRIDYTTHMKRKKKLLGYFLLLWVYSAGTEVGSY